MDAVEAKIKQNPPLNTLQCSSKTQIVLRFLATVASLAASWIMFTCKQSVILFGIEVDARYSYSPTFKFFAAANVIASVFSVASLIFVVVLGRKRANPNNYFYLFLHDLVVMTLVISACSAATAFGYVGRYGNSHTGWMPICDHFVRFCEKATISLSLSYFSFTLYLLLTILSANKSRNMLV